jgi:hypothetical protein
MVTRFALQCISGLITKKKHKIDVSLDAYWRYNDEVGRAEALMMSLRIPHKTRLRYRDIIST